MSALKQYLDLFDAHSAEIDAHAAAPLNALRPSARRVLENAVLPAPDTDNYENCDLQTMLAPDFGLNINDVGMHVNPEVTFRCGVPVTTNSPVVCVNDRVLMPDNFEELPEGVIVAPLRRAARENPDLVARFYGSVANLDNPVVALDTLLCRDGLFVYIPDGVTLERPLQLVNILQHARPLMAVRRLLIVLGDNAAAKMLVCDHTQSPACRYLALQTVEIILGENASFDYYDLEESSELTGRISSIYLKQAAGSRAVIDGMTLFNGTTRNEYYCRFDGENASLKLYGMAICDRERRISTYSRIDHAVPRCHSDELFKMSADQQSRCSFTGRIHVADGAVKTEAYQACRNLLASDSARVQVRPELEIYNDDVKCSHGCAIGQLDPLQVFYMRTRGIPEPQATLLLRQAFMSDVIDSITIPGLRDRLRLLVERRFAGACAACHEH